MTREADIRVVQRHGLRYAALRVLQMLPTLVLVLLTTFVLLQWAPGDMVQVMAGETGGASPEYMERLRESFGMNAPLHMQFLRYAGGVLRGDLGFSFRNNMPVSQLLLSRLPATVLLATAALMISVVLGLAGGVVAATWRGRWPDHCVSLVALLLYALPVFLSGVALILLFGVALPWLPVGGFTAAYGVETNWQYVQSVATHLVLPAVTLGTAYAAIHVRLTRGAMLEVQGHDFVRTARSKGLSPARIVWRHSFRNALLPLVTVIGMQTGSMLGGAILVETVFAWPGLGRLAFEALQQRDYNLLAGLILCSGTLVVVINLVVDLVYSVLDPRVRIR
ncbi:transporter [Betaproteobacteria bacterium]|nr:transporter [Betaproteobacteria bacterium]